MAPSPQQVLWNDEAVEAGVPMYFDPTIGLWVQTSATLEERGHCCGSGCRHCPFPPEEQRRAGRPETD